MEKNTWTIGDMFTEWNNTRDLWTPVAESLTQFQNERAKKHNIENIQELITQYFKEMTNR